MAPTVLAVYTRDASRPALDALPPATASASGNVAPSANVMGKSRRATLMACRISTVLNTRSGSATCAATSNGMRLAAYDAAPAAATAPAASTHGSHTDGRP